MERIKRVYGWNGTGYTSIKVLRALNYHGKVRVWNIGNEMRYRPQNFYFDLIQILQTRQFSVLSDKVINIR